MKNICFFTGSQSLLGGTERACSDIANMLQRTGYSVTILSQHNGNFSSYQIASGVELKELYPSKPQGLVGYLKTSWSLYKFVINNRPDVLVAVESLSFLFFFPLVFLLNRPALINWEHFNAKIDLGLRSRRVARRLSVLMADKIVVLSDKDKDYWNEFIGCPAHKLVRIYNVSPDLGFHDNKTSDKNKINRRVLAAGRLTHQKGFDLLIKAWAAIPRSKRCGWTLRICGEGGSRATLEELVDRLGVAAEVELVGQIAEIKYEYEGAELFVLSSRFEGFGLVALEALSYGVPVVSFDCPAGPSEIIENELDGLLVPPEDIELLAVAISNLICNESKRKLMARKALRKRPKFSERVIGSQWVALLESLGYRG